MRVLGLLLIWALVMCAANATIVLVQSQPVISGSAQYGVDQMAGYYPGSRVSIRAAGLLPTDTTCQLSSPSSPNVILPGTAACVIQAGSGVAYGGFIVGNVLPGSYVIQVTGNQGDFAQTVLTIG